MQKSIKQVWRTLSSGRITAQCKNYAEFRDTCTSLCENIDQQLFVPSMSYDTEISIADVTPQLIKELERLEPCGMSNSRPIFYLKM